MPVIATPTLFKGCAMQKKLIPWYALLFSIILICSALFVTYELYRHGFEQGLFLVALSWSAYLLCVPAAHGRLLFGSIGRGVLGASIFPEPYLWSLAVTLNVVTMIFAPEMYVMTAPAFILYRIVTTPAYWPILVLGAAGTWYRSTIGTAAYLARRDTHTLIRHLITLVGLLVFFYLMHQECIVLLNALATG